MLGLQRREITSSPDINDAEKLYVVYYNEYKFQLNRQIDRSEASLEKFAIVSLSW